MAGFGVKLAKIFARCKQRIITFVLRAAMSMPIMLGNYTAAAKPASTSQPGVQHTLAYCNTSTLTGDQFMHSIRAIIAHGDMTDISFISKSFGTKFSSKHNDGEDGKPDPQSFIYETDNVFGSPVHIDLYVDNSKSDQKIIGDIAFMRIESPGFPSPDEHFIRDCLHISASDFGSYFGGQFFLTFPTAGAPVLNSSPKPKTVNNGSDFGSPLEWDAIQTEGSIGKNGSKIYLGFSYGSKDNIVFDAVLRQEPKSSK